MGRREIMAGEGHSNPFEERPETDAEWHGRVLETIEMRQGLANDYLEDMNKNLDHINDCLHQIQKHLEYSKYREKQTPPMPAWQFIFSWIIAIILFAVFLLYK